MKVSLNVDLKILHNFDKFKKSIEVNVIKTGMDDILQPALEELKERLLKEFTENPKVDIKDKSEINSDEILDSIPQSQAIWIQELTGADFSKYNFAKTYSTLSEANVMPINSFFNSKKNFDYLSTRLKMPIGPNETFEQHHFQAKKFFNTAVFTIRDSSGNLQILVNPGIDISRYVKVVCSTDSGDTTKSRNRFEQHKNRRNEAEWALTMDGVKYVKQNFINLMPTVMELQQNNFDNAAQLIRMAASKSSTLQNKLLGKISDTKQNNSKSTSVNTLAYTKIVQAIKDLKIQKDIKENGTVYGLYTPGETESPEYIEFFTYIEQQISLWKIYQSDKWFKALVLKTEKLIKEFGISEELELEGA